jgi:hypothetical protein
MQTDMHYYGTYAIARMAGLTARDAKVVAYSAQFVDDSTKSDSDEHPDGGLIYGVATAHTNSQVAKNRLVNKIEQKRVWTPFHFIPGGQGETLEDKLVCQKDSLIAQQMFKHHISVAKDADYGLQLIGIASHVYADTFSHYGFSGVSTKFNKVDPDSISLIDVKNSQMEAYLMNKYNAFLKKYAPGFVIKMWRTIANKVAEQFSGALGHGGVGTYPDRPFLHWQFNYAESGAVSDRNNRETFTEGAEKLYHMLVAFAQEKDPTHKPLADFAEKRDIIAEIIATEAPMAGRIEQWKQAILSRQLYLSDEEEYLQYDHLEWEEQKTKTFVHLDSSSDAPKLEVYQFHQAAIYHRYFVLKHLLPKHGIVIY